VAQLERPLRLEVQRPADAVPDRGGVRVALQARLGEGLAGVTEYMTAYPYTCLEQRFSKLVALNDRPGWGAFTEVLPRHQDRRGLLKYFASDWLEGDDALTAYILAAANEGGWQLPPAVQGKALDGLEAFVEGRAPRRTAFGAPDLVVRKLAAIAALSRYGRAAPQQLQSLTVDPANWPTSALLDWVGILQRVEGVPDREGRLGEARRLLRGRLDLQGTALRFKGEQADRLWWLMVSGDSNAARLLLAVVDDPAWREEMPGLALGLLGRLARGHWDTTVANAWGTLAMERFSRRFEADPVSGTTTATLGAAHKAVEWVEGKRPPAIEFAWAGAAPESLGASHQGQGRPWAFVQSRAAIPLSAPVSAGFSVARTLTPVEQRRPGQWTKGDVARIRLEIDARSEHAWVVVDDPIPAGASILGGGLGRDSALLTAAERRGGGAWPVFEERRFDAYRAYYERVPAGRWTLEYSVRFDNPGSFELPATRVEALYAPEVFAEVPNAPVVVEARE
jgi:alpha-2-macroglobulin